MEKERPCRVELGRQTDMGEFKIEIAQCKMEQRQRGIKSSEQNPRRWQGHFRKDK
jgi:hypothetical protein